jgi:REP-associated tyrosine transposase
MRESAMPWPHAPTHQLSDLGTYFVTAGTYLKAHHFHTPQRLDVLHRGLLSVTRDFSWGLEAWAVFLVRADGLTRNRTLDISI